MSNEPTKHDQGKPQLTLLDPVFREEVARVLALGEAKYGRGNWKGGLGTARLLDAVLRHVAALEQREELDPDTGLSHAAHAAAGLQMYDWTRRNLSEYQRDEHFPREELPQVRSGADHGEHVTEQAEEVRLELQPVCEPEVVEVDTGEAKAQARGSGAVDPGLRQRGDLQDLTTRVVEWADSVFPNREEEDALRKLMLEEIPELLNGGRDDPGEYADVLILLVDVAHMRGVDLVAAAQEKMAVNEARSWEYDPKTGSIHHVREEREE